MSKYLNFHHIERYGSAKVENAHIGMCYVFPKIDGTYGCIRYKIGNIEFANKDRYLSIDDDNQKFVETLSFDIKRYKDFFSKYPDLTLHGEFLIPHTVTTYTDDAWYKFYVFDVEKNGVYLNYDTYIEYLEEFGINYIPAICKVANPDIDGLISLLDKNIYLMKDGSGCGEGIVIKNYEWRNNNNHQKWMKVVCNEFKTGLYKRTCQEFNLKKSIEQKIIDKYVSIPFVEKEWMKICNDEKIQIKYRITVFLNKVYYELVNEEMWNIVKTLKYPVIDFKKLYNLCIDRVKNIKPELF